jgi:hypothetical protein
MKFLILGLILFSGCKNFYDSADDDEASNSQQLVNVSYVATLSSTDKIVPAIVGNASVDVQGDSVFVKVNLDGVPVNVTQIHYGYIAADCSLITLAIPDDSTDTRMVNLTEQTTPVGLQNDLVASGASRFNGDFSLEDKSFVVKGFSPFTTIPNTSGTNSITIACGPLNVSGSFTTTDDEATNNSSTDSGP